ncbi:MAG: hypothetical protein ACT4PM_02130 [Gemmatimonadales bacterium]
MRIVPASLALFVLSSGCASGGPRTVPVLSPTQVEEPVTAVLMAAFAADCQRQHADSLWDRDATVVADGELRHAPPRFAGVGLGGEVAITASRLELRQRLAWIYVEYRWSQLQAGLAQEGKATVLLVPRESGPGWVIVHAHSSSRDREKGS